MLIHSSVLLMTKGAYTAHNSLNAASAINAHLHSKTQVSRTNCWIIGNWFYLALMNPVTYSLPFIMQTIFIFHPVSVVWLIYHSYLFVRN